MPLEADQYQQQKKGDWKLKCVFMLAHITCAPPCLSYPASRWLHKRLMAALLCRPCPAHHSQQVLLRTNQRTNQIMTLYVQM